MGAVKGSIGRREADVYIHARVVPTYNTHVPGPVEELVLGEDEAARALLLGRGGRGAALERRAVVRVHVVVHGRLPLALAHVEDDAVLAAVAVVLPLELEEVPLLRVVQQRELGQVVLHVRLVLGLQLLRLRLAALQDQVDVLVRQALLARGVEDLVGAELDHRQQLVLAHGRVLLCQPPLVSGRQSRQGSVLVG